MARKSASVALVVDRTSERNAAFVATRDDPRAVGRPRDLVEPRFIRAVDGGCLRARARIEKAQRTAIDDDDRAAIRRHRVRLVVLGGLAPRRPRGNVADAQVAVPDDAGDAGQHRAVG